MQGTVKWFSSEKGYGFITSDSGEDHYFNVQSIKGATLLSNGDRVNFESKPGNKGLRALQVTITEKTTTQQKGRVDERVNCPGCNRKIVPRINFYQGKPEKSYCPFCAAEVEDFTSGCFIATAVYDNPNCYEVIALRHFRDTHLITNFFGKLFVHIYYFLSPPIAN